MDEVEHLRRRVADLEAQVSGLQLASANASSSDAAVLIALRAAERRNSQIIDSAIDFAIVATQTVKNWSGTSIK